MKRVISILIISLLIFSLSISCKKENEPFITTNKSTGFRIQNLDFTTYKYEKLFVNKLQKFREKEFNGIFIGNNVDYQNGKIVSKINKKLFVIILDNNDNVLNICPVYDPVFHCDCVDNNDPLNYCEDFVDEQGRLRCRGSSCCEGYLTDDGGGNGVQRVVDNGIIVTCDKLIFNNTVYK